MFFLIAAALLAQSSPRPVAVLASSKRPAVDQYVTVFTARAHAVLKREGVAPLIEEAAAWEQLKLAGVSDPRGCQGSRACVARMATILGPHTVVVGIDVGKAGQSLAVIMEAVAADTGLAIHTSEFEVPIAKYSDASALPVTLFARELKKKLDADRPVVVEKAKDAPVQVALVPAPAPSRPPELISTPARSGARTGLGVVSFSLAGAGLVCSAAFAFLGKNARDQAFDGFNPVTNTSPLTRTKAVAFANQANTDFTLATAALISAGVFTALGIYFFASNP